MRINARRPAKEKKVNWTHLFHVVLITWLAITVPAIAAVAVITKFGKDSTKEYIPYHDTRDTLPYSGMGLSLVLLWLLLWGIGYCLLKKTRDEESCIEQAGLRTFLVTGAITGASGACWWLWKKSPLDSPIPDLPKVAFFALAASAVASLALLTVFGCLAQICCRSACHRAFCLEKSELQEAFVEPPADDDQHEVVGENPEPEGSPRRKPRQYYQGGQLGPRA